MQEWCSEPYNKPAGSGKSYLALLYCLQFIHDPHFRGVFVRQSSTQLLQSGGLWQEALDLYAPFGIKSKQHPHLVIVFPSGAQIQFKVCQTDADTKNFDGG